MVNERCRPPRIHPRPARPLFSSSSSFSPSRGDTRTRAERPGAYADSFHTPGASPMHTGAEEKDVFVAPRRIQVLDTTLRDGEQSPGVALQPHEKAEIALRLEALGVDVVEAGFPAASPGDFAGVRAVAEALQRATVSAFA